MDFTLDDTENLFQNTPEWQIRNLRQRYVPQRMKRRGDVFSEFYFKWSESQYTPSELLDVFGHYVPFLIMATTGYLGRDEGIHSVSSDEIYWFKGIITLPRLIVVNEKNAYFSIPLTCKNPVLAVKDDTKVGEPTTVKNIVEEGLYGSFVFVNDGLYDVCVGAALGVSFKLGKLKIVDNYKERYLLLHALSSDTLHYEAAVIPVYLPTRFVIAVGLAKGDAHDFFELMLDMDQFIHKIPKVMAFPMQLRDYDDIMVFDKKPKGTIYDLLKPDRYVTLKQIHERHNNKEASHIYMPLRFEQSKRSNPPTLPKRDHKRSRLGSNMSNIKDLLPDPSNDALKYCMTSAEMTKLGYFIVNIDPEEVLHTLKNVLQMGVIPDRPSAIMVEVSDARSPKEQCYRGNASKTSRVQPQHSATNKQTDVQKTLDSPQSKISRGTPQSVTKSGNDDGTRQKIKVTSFCDIPADISKLSCEDVTTCLTLLRLSKHKDKFEEAQIDGCLLSDLDKDILQDEFGFSKFEASKFMKFLGGWRPNNESNESVL